MNRYFGVLMIVLVLGTFYFLFTEVLKGKNVSDLIGPFSLGKFFLSKSAESPPKPKAPSQAYVEASKKETSTPPPGFTASQLSPHYQKVRLSSVYQNSSLNGVSQFMLRGNFSGSERINILGWRVRTNKGNFLTVPKAIASYTPFGSLNEVEIILDSDDYVYFYSSKSPIRNLRLNQCTGYLNRVYNFNPSLPENCPSLYERRDIISFSGGCQNFIMSLGGCEMPDANKLGVFTNPDDYMCRPFLERFNYRGCYDRYSNSPNFFSNEWRVWLDQQFPFDRDHDRLLLFDENGLIVDEYFY